MAKKSASLAILLAIIVCGLVFVENLQFSVAQTGTNVSRIISQDSTWTRANSPYNLTGNLAIDREVTLTIEAGVTVNLNSYYMLVNGTLIAKGTNTNNIHIDSLPGGKIDFANISTAWNPQAGTGCIIENAVVNAILDAGVASVLINNNTITRGLIVGKSSVVSKNTIAVLGYDPLSRAQAIAVAGNAQIVDNTISGGFEFTAVYVGRGSPIIQRNIISNSYGYGGDPGYGQTGITIEGETSPLIEQNTIVRCANGISIGYGASLSVPPMIVYNNFESITTYNLRIGSRNFNVNATNNWWGTTDTATIDQKIYDYEDDFKLGKINYTPILTEKNPQAMPDLNAPIPTPNPTATPAITSSIMPTQTQPPSPSSTITSTTIPSPSLSASPTVSNQPTMGSFQADGYVAVIVALILVVAVMGAAIVELARRNKKLSGAKK